MRSIRDIPVFENIPILVRTSLNVPVENGAVANSFRLKSALPTISFLRERHARVILASHISGAGTETLRPMFEAMQEWIPGLAFCPVSAGEEARAAARALPPGGVLMLENLRRNAGEEKNDPAFAKELAALAVIAGAKFSTKEPVLKKLLRTYDRVMVGGALANDFIRAEGYPVGASLVSDEGRESVAALLKNKKLVVPIDALVAPAGASRDAARTAELSDVRPSEAILDTGPRTNAMLAAYASKAKSVLWNGPLGLYEHGFSDGTLALARAIAGGKSHSVVGGGDTVAAIESLGLSDRFSFISTGGGAMLDFLADGTLPGLAALR